MLKKAMETPEKNSLNDIETDFVNHAIEKSKELTIFLVNGIKLQGQIESFDQFVILLKNTVSQMVYKSAISTVVPARNVKLVVDDQE